MSKIRVTSKCQIYDGMSFTFKAPCDCDTVDGLKVYYTDPEDASSQTSQTFTFKDALGNDLTGIDNVFAEGAYVKVVLDTRNGYAYIQNGAPNAYLTGKADIVQSTEYAGKFWKVGKDGTLTFENPIAKFTQGPVIIDTTQTLDLTKYGLKVGDQVNVVCVGGGCGGYGDTYGMGGNAGKGGGTFGGYVGYGTGGGGGGGGYGGGGGGAGGSCYSSPGVGGQGGASGYATSGTVTLTSTTVAITIGAGGQGGMNGSNSSTAPKAGGTTSFGSYLSAAGGSSQSAGGHPGGQVTVSRDGAGRPVSAVGGGGGGGGWHITSATVYSGTAGETATTQNGAAGGTDGGAGGTYSSMGYTSGGDGGVGHGVVVFWY